MTLDRRRISTLRARESARFIEDHPKSQALLARGRRSMPSGVPMAWMASFLDHPPMFVAEGKGAYFTDVDGRRYLDMNIADSSMACGYAPPSVVRAVCEGIKRGGQFLLPGEDAVAVAEALAERFGLPRWQFTLAASSAATESFRLARAATGRRMIVMFDGKYHGHIDDSLVQLADGAVRPEGLGLLADPAARTRIVQFNDLNAVEAALKPGDVACVIAEPAHTNYTMLMPEPGFHQGLRALTREHGALLILDEAHTHICAFGGLTRAWCLQPDVLIIGKSLSGGVPLGAYGMSEALAELLEPDIQVDYGRLDLESRRIATGGTLFANALSMAAARATLEEILTEETQLRAAALGARLSDGIESHARAAGLDWAAHRLYCRSGYFFGPRLPRNAIEARAGDDAELVALMRVFMANRGVWEAIAKQNPIASFAMTEDDINLYLEVFGELTLALTEG
jgi:glutamate-1-semialdehyde 2,1-aminomutase